MDKVFLIGTKTCPNCRIADKKLSTLGINFTKVYVEDDPDFVKKVGVKSAPCLYIEKESGETEMYSNVSAIIRWGEGQIK